MSRASEEQISFTSDSASLSGFLHIPEGRCRGSVLFCNPLFEERKSSQRVMVECARALCDDGLMVLRFDYRGCGDSDGSFEESVPADWISDIRQAAELLTARSGSKELGVLGLRYGANLALQSFRSGSPKFFVLWEPIVDGKSYIDHELRCKLLREMVTFGKGRGSRQSLSDALERGETIDLDGYPVTAALYRAIKAQILADELSEVKGAMFAANVTHNDELTGKMAWLPEFLRERGQHFEAIKEQPFWNRVGLVECPLLIQRTREWIGSNLADG